MAETVEPINLLRPMRIGITLSILSILLGFGLGGIFGGFEREAKDYLKRAAISADASVYDGDVSQRRKATKKAWGYLKRSHMHGGAIGATALALCVMLGLCGRPSRLARSLVSAALGAGSLGYSVYWLLAAVRTASMGGAGEAKASLEWLAVPSAGLLIVGVIASLALFIQQTFFKGGATAQAEA